MGKCSKASKAYYQERFISNLNKGRTSEESVYHAITFATGKPFDCHSFDSTLAYRKSMRLAEAAGEKSDVWYQDGNYDIGVEVKYRPSSSAIRSEDYAREIGDKLKGHEVKICVYYGPDIGEVPTLCDKDGVVLFWFESGTPEDNWLTLVFQLKLHWNLIDYVKSGHVLVSDDVEVPETPMRKSTRFITYTMNYHSISDSLEPLCSVSSPAFVSEEVFHGKGPPDSTPNLSVSDLWLAWAVLKIK